MDKNWKEDSDTIFTVISTGADNHALAIRMILPYVLDSTYSRAGISHALKRLEEHYKKVDEGEV